MKKIWELGPHRLLCGDCRLEKDVDEVLDGEKPVLCVTSPPYNQGLNLRLIALKKKRPGKFIENSRNHLIKMAAAYEDSLPEEIYQKEQIAILDLLFDKIAAGGSLYYVHKLRYRNRKCLHPVEWILKTKWSLRQEIIWDKHSSLVQNARMFVPQDERIYWLVKGKDYYFDDISKKYGSIWPISSKNTVTFDCLPFPNKLVGRCIAASSCEGELIIDPYAGTGTTLIEADRLNRRCFLIEIDEKRCKEIIIPRWEAWCRKKGAVKTAPFE